MTNWQILFDQQEAVFKRPFKERLLWGIVAIGFVSLLVFFVVAVLPKRGEPDQGQLLFGCLCFAIGTPILSLRAGPKEMHFDFRRQQYWLRMGLPLLSRKKTGSFCEISCLRIVNTRDFTGLSIEWESSNRLITAFVSCSTYHEAQALGDKLGEQLKVPAVKLGVQRG
ncbi:MAG: hypothetical protein ACRYFS_09420 [Janthinobacterium lividum]